MAVLFSLSATLRLKRGSSLRLCAGCRGTTCRSAERPARAKPPAGGGPLSDRSQKQSESSPFCRVKNSRRRNSFTLPAVSQEHNLNQFTHFRPPALGTRRAVHMKEPSRHKPMLPTWRHLCWDPRFCHRSWGQSTSLPSPLPLPLP
jgi:hypothetical protein